MSPDAGRNLSGSAEQRSARDRVPALFVIVAMIVGIGYAFITPPFRVPDEPSHFWRAAAIAYGHPFPATTFKGAWVALPRGFDTFVRVLYRFEDHPHYTVADLRRGADVPLGSEPLPVPFSTWYTPLVYVPQTCAAFAGRLLEWPPFYTFYLGRLTNLLISILVVAAAMRVAPRWRLIFAATALLPMSMYEFASWSADATTVSVGCLVAALVLRGLSSESRMSAAEERTIAAGAFAAALCKPVYFLTPLLIWLVPRQRFESKKRAVRFALVVTVVTAAGLTLSVIAARWAYYNPRFGLPVDPAQQLRCVVANPLGFVRLVATDFRANGFYIEAAIGRLGWNSLKLPPVLIAAELAVLALIAVAGGAASLTFAQRAATLIVVAATAFGVALSQYLIWTIVCADAIEGIQGRYLLPVLPLAIAAVTITRRRTLPEWAVIAALGVLDAVALGVLAHHFWLV